MPTEATRPAGDIKRYYALDTWRFLAALGVVAYHFENHLSALAPSPSHRLTAFGYFVDFFFVLSGFVLMHTYGDRVRSMADFGDFMRKRLARVYPLHAAVTLVFGAIAIYIAVRHVPMRDPASMDPHQIAPHLLLVHAWGLGGQPSLNFPSWSISAELFVYILFPLFALVLTRIGPVRTLVLAFVFACAMIALRMALGMRPFAEATNDYGMLRAVPTFLSGMAVCVIVRSLPRDAVSWVSAHACMMIVLVLLAMDASIYAVLPCFVFAVGLIAAAERSGARSVLQHPLCVKLGDASYAVYLLHTAFQVATLVVARKLGLTTWPQLIALACVGGLVIVLASLACYRWFENPARRFFGRPIAQWFTPRARRTARETAA